MGKILFSQVSDCSHFGIGGGGTYLGQGGGISTFHWGEGVPALDGERGYRSTYLEWVGVPSFNRGRGNPP